MSDLLSIFHEKQDGLLCAQHCLNNLLQGSYFMATDLSEIARELDADELKAMVDGNPAESKTIEEDFNKEGSPNYDDTGFFSLTVIEKALQVFGIALIPIASSDRLAVEAKRNPQREKAFILNLNEHWYTLRKFGNSEDRWYDLNSMSSAPKHVSKTYLGMLLDQMETEGYSIFVAKGDIPETEADQMAKLIPIPPAGSLLVNRTVKNDEDNDLEKAIKLSMGNSNVEEDEELEKALKASLKEADEGSKSFEIAIAASLADSGFEPSKSPKKGSELSPEEIRRKRLEKFG